MTTPRDPLKNETLRVQESEQVHSNVAVAYRLLYRPNSLDYGTLYTLHGAFKSYDSHCVLIHEWRDIPTVVV